MSESGRFGERLWAWVEDKLGLARLRAFFDEDISAFVGRWWEAFKAVMAYPITHPGTPWPLWFAHGASVLLGRPTPEATRAEQVLQAMTSDPSGFVADTLADAATGGPLRETLETLGAAIYDLSVAAITGQPLPRDSAAAERARAFVGYVTALGAAPQIVAATLEAGSIGQIDQFGTQIQQVYYNLGLGFLTWQTMSPILDAAILGPLERDVQRQWRNQRFTRAQLQELFALGQISREQMREGLREEGWPEESIALVEELAYRTLTRGEVFSLWHEGIIDDNELGRRLRTLGYHPDDIVLLYALERREDVEDDRAESISTLTRAFREGLLTDNEYRVALRDQRYTEREIDLRIGIVRLQQESDRRRLSVAQLKAAWEVNRVGDPEALKRLTEMGYPSDEAQVLLDTWITESEPEFARINRSTVLEMYRHAVLTRGAARDMLLDLNYSEADAEALLDLEEARHPEAFGAPPARRERFLSLRALADLFQMGRIDEARVRAGVEALGFTGDDLEYQVELVTAPSEAPPRPLSQSTIEEAYLTGVLDRTEALNNLAAIGLTPEAAEIIVKTVEAGHPAIFAPETVTAVRMPSIGALVEAVRNSFIDEVEFFRRAQEIGFTRDGAALYLANARSGQARSVKSLTKTDVLSIYKKGLFGYSEALSELEGLGYSYRDADLLLREQVGGVENSDVWKCMLSGVFELEEGVQALLTLGFSEDDITAALEAAFEKGLLQ